MQAYPKSIFSLIRSTTHSLLSARVMHAPVWPNGASPRGIQDRFQLCWIGSPSLSSSITFNTLQQTIALVFLVECQIQHTHCIWSKIALVTWKVAFQTWHVRAYPNFLISFYKCQQNQHTKRKWKIILLTIDTMTLTWFNINPIVLQPIIKYKNTLLWLFKKKTRCLEYTRVIVVSFRILHIWA